MRTPRVVAVAGDGTLAVYPFLLAAVAPAIALWLSAALGLTALQPDGWPLSGLSLASGVGLAACLKLRWHALPFVGVGLLAGTVATASPAAYGEAAAMTAAIAAAAAAMRWTHKRGLTEGHLRRWMAMFVGGAGCYALVHALVVTGLRVNDGLGPMPLATLTQALVGDVLGITLVMAIAGSVRDLRHGWHIWRQALPLILTACAGLIALAATASTASDAVMPDNYLLICLPIALWIARQPVSLPGAAVTAVANIAGLGIIVASAGSVLSPIYAQTQFLLLALTINAQVIHMVELDRLSEAEDSARHRRALHDLLTLVTRDMRMNGKRGPGSCYHHRR